MKVMIIDNLSHQVIVILHIGQVNFHKINADRNQLSRNESQ